MKNAKYIFVVGGVMSSVGKGITTASLGNILKSRGYDITLIKCDLYLNVDAGTIRPTEHGEVFVCNDGTEADQDLGNYERFTGMTTSKANYITNGQIYKTIIERERNLEYQGEDVEIVPDVPNEIIKRITEARNESGAEITLIEIGGTVGEYQNILFLEAGRMMKLKNPDDVVFVMVSYLPVPSMVGEMKTKPTQHAIRSLNAAGINPDFLICRSEMEIDESRKQKLANNCGIPKDHIIAAPDVESTYAVPVMFKEQRLDTLILKQLRWPEKDDHFDSWKTLVKNIHQCCERDLRIGMIGKYFKTGGKSQLTDSYISVIEAAKHAAWAENRKPVFEWIDSEEFEKKSPSYEALDRLDAIIVPGGFGTRGIEGIVNAITYARTHSIPLLGICYGMQLAIVEFARNVMELEHANTTEADPKTPHPVIDFIPEQKANIAKKHFGGTMRLGAYACELKEGSKAHALYGTERISERHRHRWEFNDAYKARFEERGIVFSGINPESNLVEITEFPNHPFMIGCQFHPEFQSTPLAPHPLFLGLMRAGKKKINVKTTAKKKSSNEKKTR